MASNDTDTEAAATKTTTTTTTTTTGLDYSILASHSALSYGGIFVSGIVLMVSLTSSSVHRNHDHYEYGIAVASVAMICSLVGWGLAQNAAGNEKLAKMIQWNNYFLFVWCFVGAGVLTFGGPFDVAGNGFFGSWGLVLFATMAVGVTWSTVQQHSGPIMGLFASAVVVLVAISSHGVKKNDGDFGQLVYGLVLSILTILLVGAMIKSSPDQLLPQSQQYILMVVFSIMWIVAASLLTFSGPFLNTGNGYFGAWGGAITAVFAMNAASQSQSTTTTTTSTGH